MFRFSGDSVGGSNLVFGLSNVIPAREYILDVDGTEDTRRFSDAGGNVSFSWTNWSLHSFHVRLGSGSGLPGPDPLAADFVFSPATSVAGDPVTFAASVAGGTPPYVLAWDFGDGSTAAGVSVSHVFATAGSYNAVLIASDAGSQTRTVTKTVSVSSAPPPTTLAADFSFSPPTPRVGESVEFVAATSGGVPPYGYSWAFGDGVTGPGSPANHAYAAAGSFGVELNVTDSAGGFLLVMKTVQVLAQPPEGNVTALFDLTVNGFTVSFVDRSTADPGLTITSWFWAFGDGVSSLEPSPTHAYAVTGFLQTFTVLFVVCDTDANRCDTVSRDVTLYNSLLISGTFGLLAAIAVPMLLLLRRRRKRRSRETRQGAADRDARDGGAD